MVLGAAVLDNWFYVISFTQLGIIPCNKKRYGGLLLTTFDNTTGPTPLFWKEELHQKSKGLQMVKLSNHISLLISDIWSKCKIVYI